MVHRLLHCKKREKVPRTYSELLTRARPAEDTFNDSVIKSETFHDTNKSGSRCTFGKNVGHAIDECRKLVTRKKSLESDSKLENSGSSNVSSSSVNSVNSKPTINLTCYGGKRPGYIR